MENEDKSDGVELWPASDVTATCDSVMGGDV